MRTIKFRAWNPHGELLYSHNNITNHSNFQLKWFFERCHEDAKIMQYTGLKDKDGKEIYDGDVLGGWPHGTVAVRWNEEYACWETYWYETNDSDYEIKPVIECDGMLGNDLKDCKDAWNVIGNIYENPELLIHPGQKNEAKPLL